MSSVALTLILLLTAAAAVGFIIHRRRHGVEHLTTDDPIERRRGHRQAIGPDGKALLIGRAVRTTCTIAAPEQAPPPPTKPAPERQPPTPHSTPVRATGLKVRRDRAGGISIELQGQTFTTPLWGRAPRDAARDLYRYAVYATRLDSAAIKGQHGPAHH